MSDTNIEKVGLSNSSEFGRSYVICIGVNAYQNGIAPLRSARPDAEAVASCLIKQHGYFPLAVPQPLDEDASITKLRTLFKSLPEKIEPMDRLLVYFAGHGIARGDEDEGPRGYLLPQDANSQDETTWISMQELRGYLEKLQCRHLLVILDCCFAGSFRWTSSRDIVLPPHRLYYSQYQRFLTGTAWQVLTSATHDERASDITPWKDNFRDTEAEHSPFAEALLRGLAGEADTARGASTVDGVITATDLYLFIYKVFHEKSLEIDLAQTPGIWPLSRENNAEFVFRNPQRPLRIDPDPPLNDEQNPWRGLHTYTEDDKPLFFGRERVISKLRELLNDANLLVVLGASGTGKSSVVRAGLLPLLKGDGKSYLGPFRPGAKPLAILDEIDPATGASSLLVIDQLEEVFTQCRDSKEREAFLTALAKRIDHGQRVLVTLRSDFEPRLVTSALWSHVGTGRYILPPLNLNEYRSVIQGPAIARALFFEPAEIEDLLVNEVLAMPGGLPLLSFALSEMYRQSVLRRRQNGSTDRSITEQDYKAAGGVIGAIHTRADAVFEAATASKKLTIRRLFLRLVSIEAGHRVRRTVSHRELEFEDRREQQRLRQVLDAFTKTRLLVIDERGVEVSHDTLLLAWGRLDEWLDKDIESAIAQQRIWQAAVVWDSGGRDQGLLWPDYPRSLWFVDPNQRQRLNHLEQDFLDASEALRQERIRQLEYERDRAHDAILMDAARRELSNPTRAVQFLREVRYFEQTRDWYMMALNACVHPIAWKTLDNISTSFEFSNDGRYFVVSGHDGIVQIFQLGRVSDPVLLQHKGKSDSPSFSLSPDGRKIVTASNDEAYPEAKIWDTDSQSEPVNLAGHEAMLYNPKFSPDGRWIYTASKDEVSRLWRPNGRNSLLLSGNENVPVYCVAFSPDGRWIATTTNDDMVRLHSADGIGDTVLLEGHENIILSVNFSVDGSALVTASMDGTARVWLVNHPEKAVILKGHGNSVKYADFSPDSRKVVTASYDGTARVWNADGSGKTTVFECNDVVNSAVFSPDGAAVLTATSDGTVRIWQLDRRAKPITFQESSPVNAAIFSPDGHHVATASLDGNVRIWRTDRIGDPIVLKGHSVVNSLVFSRDGKTLLTALDNKTVNIWPANGHGKPRILRGHTGSVCNAVYSPDGRSIASAAEDGTVRIWQTAYRARRSKIFVDFRGWASRAIFSPSGEWVLLRNGSGLDSQLRCLNRGAGYIKIEGTLHSEAFSPDGKTLATLVDNGVLSVRCLDNPSESHVLLVPDTRVTSFSFSPDGRWIMAALADGTVRVWPASGTGDPIVFRLHRRIVNSVAFSADGNWIITASRDSRIGLQRLDRSDKPLYLEGHEGEVVSASFSPNGSRILSLSKDGMVRIWLRDHPYDSFAFEHREVGIDQASFSPDGRWMVTASQVLTRLWDMQRENEMQILKGHEGEITFASFSPDGHYILTISLDKTARIWPLDRPGNPVILKTMRSFFKKVEISQDGQHILTISNNMQVRLWRVDGQGDPRVLSGGRHGFSFAKFTADSKKVITSDFAGGTIRVWPLDPQVEPRILYIGANYFAISPDGSKLVATDSHDLQILSIDGSEDPINLDTKEVGNDQIREPIFSPDGSWILADSYWNMPRLWQANGQGKIISLEENGFGASHHSFSPVGNLLATVIRGTLRVKALGRKGKSKMIVKEVESLNYLTFSPDGSSLFLGLESGDIQVWPVYPPGEQITLRGLGSQVDEIAFSPDGSWIIVNPGYNRSIGNSTWIWRTDGSGSPIVVESPDGRASFATFTPDGRWLLTTSGGPIARLWRWRSPEELMQTLWKLTEDCPSPEERIELLGLTPARAKENYARSHGRVDRSY